MQALVERGDAFRVHEDRRLAPRLTEPGAPAGRDPLAALGAVHADLELDERHQTIRRPRARPPRSRSGTSAAPSRGRRARGPEDAPAAERGIGVRVEGLAVIAVTAATVSAAPRAEAAQRDETAAADRGV